jgi:hypothetical protein
MFAFNEASKPIVVNKTSTLNYYEAGVNNEDEDFIMEGGITVVNQPSHTTTPFSNAVTHNLLTSSSPTSPTSTNNPATANLNSNIDTVGTFMVPTQDIDSYVSRLVDRGFVIDSMHDFQDLRGGQEGTGDRQTLIVWGADSSSMNLNNIVSTLKEITPELPYS